MQKKKHKINLISILVHQVVKICLPATLKNEFDNLRQNLANNGCPLDVSNTAIAKVTDPAMSRLILLIMRQKNELST